MVATDITDEERREVARRLRHIVHQPPEWATAACIIAETFDDNYPLWRDPGPLFDTLADFIDRPTCRNIGGQDGTNGEYYDFACSACGFMCDIADPYYCPYCGSEVVE